MEEHYDRLVVHSVPVRDAEYIWPRAGAYADPDPCQPQGGTGLRVCVQHARVPRQETDSLHHVPAHQRDVLHTLNETYTRMRPQLAMFIIIIIILLYI